MESLLSFTRNFLQMTGTGLSAMRHWDTIYGKAISSTAHATIEGRFRPPQPQGESIMREYGYDIQNIRTSVQKSEGGASRNGENRHLNEVGVISGQNFATSGHLAETCSGSSSTSVYGGAGHVLGSSRTIPGRGANAVVSGRAGSSDISGRGQNSVERGLAGQGMPRAGISGGVQSSRFMHAVRAMNSKGRGTQSSVPNDTSGTPSIQPSGKGTPSFLTASTIGLPASAQSTHEEGTLSTVPRVQMHGEAASGTGMLSAFEGQRERGLHQSGALNGWEDILPTSRRLNAEEALIRGTSVMETAGRRQMAFTGAASCRSDGGLVSGRESRGRGAVPNGANADASTSLVLSGGVAGSLCIRPESDMVVHVHSASEGGSQWGDPSFRKKMLVSFPSL